MRKLNLHVLLRVCQKKSIQGELWLYLFFLAVLAIPFRADAQAPQVRIPTRAALVDAPPINLAFSLPASPIARSDSEITITLSLAAGIDLDAASITTVLAGVDMAASRPWRQETPSVGPNTKGVPTRQFSSQLGAVRLGSVREFRLPLQFGDLEYGYIAATVEAGRENTDESIGESTILYFLITDDSIFFSPISPLDLDIQRLRHDLTRQELPVEEIERAILDLAGAGATVEVKINPPPADAPQGNPFNSITVYGTAYFTENGNTFHPIRNANVEITGVAAFDIFGFDVDIYFSQLAQTSTNNDGEYAVTFPLPSLGPSPLNSIVPDLSSMTVRIYAEGPAARVVHPQNNQAWAMGWSTAPEQIVGDDFVVEVNFTAHTNDLDRANLVAFEIYEAVNHIAGYLTELEESVPAAIPVKFPTGSNSYSPGDRSIWLKKEQYFPATDQWLRFRWSTILHEYAHYIQDLYGIANSPGGNHLLAEALCGFERVVGEDEDGNIIQETLNKDQGIRLAWGEAWATFFGTMVANELELENIGITSATFPLEDPLYLLGEAGEWAIAGTLWDLYDNEDESPVDIDDPIAVNFWTGIGDADVALSPRELWDLVIASQPHNFSEFWQALIEGQSWEDVARYGAILSLNSIAPSPTMPVPNHTFLSSSVQPFIWEEDPDSSCDTGGNTRYSLRVYGDDQSLVWASPWQDADQLDPSVTTQTMFVGGPIKRWGVTKRELTQPATGPYYSGTRRLQEHLNPIVQRRPLDIVVLANTSDSMNQRVGSRARSEVAAAALESFLNVWNNHAQQNDRIGAVFFNDGADSWLSPGGSDFAEMNASNAESLVQELESRFPAGCTALGGGMQLAFNAFPKRFDRRSAPFYDRKSAIILLTDDGPQSMNPFVIPVQGYPIASGPVFPFLPAGPAFRRLKIEFVSDPQFPDPELMGCGGPTEIIPDGQFLFEHEAAIHVMSIDVASRETGPFLSAVARETGGTERNVVKLDEDFDIFLTNELLDSLNESSK